MYHAKKKLRLLDSELDAANADATTVATTDSAAAVTAVTNGLSIIAEVNALPPLTVPPPSPTDSRLLPTSPQQLIHGL